MNDLLTEPDMKTDHHDPEIPDERGSSPVSRRSQVMIVLATALVAVAVAGAYLGLRHSSYQATSDVLVTPVQSDDQYLGSIPLIHESSDGSRPVQTAAVLLSASDIPGATARQLGGPWTRTRVASDIQVVPSGESDVVAITATDSSARDAARVANAYVSTALRLRRQALEPAVQAALRDLNRGRTLSGGVPVSYERKRLTTIAVNGDPTLSQSAVAVPPASSAGKSAPVVLAVALIAGLVLGLGVAGTRAALAGNARV